MLSLRSALVLAWMSIGMLCANPPATTKPQSPPKQGAREQVASLSWLAGTWEGAMWGGTFVAYYSTPDGGKVLSHSQLQRENKTVFYEFEVMEVVGDKVMLHPHPGGKKAVSLQLHTSDAKARKAVFENPKKDYPTRIVYHRSAEDRLVITLSDPHGSSDKVEKFDLRRQR